jgi:hypothetical protein
VYGLRDGRVPQLLALTVDECWDWNEGTALNLVCEVSRHLPEEWQRDYDLERFAVTDWRSGVQLARPRSDHD